MNVLEIRHRVHLSGERYVVTETFGDRETVWEAGSFAAAQEIITKRKAILLEMVASISLEAREAVEDARHIDNLKAGRA